MGRTSRPPKSERRPEVEKMPPEDTGYGTKYALGSMTPVTAPPPFAVLSEDDRFAASATLLLTAAAGTCMSLFSDNSACNPHDCNARFLKHREMSRRKPKQSKTKQSRQCDVRIYC